jgi:hypothetical protein
MNPEPERARTLREIEQEVMAEGREWTRKRLPQRLQEEADRQGGVFPLSRSPVVHRRHRLMQMQTEAGVVQLEVVYGQDATDQHWGCPVLAAVAANVGASILDLQPKLRPPVLLTTALASAHSCLLPRLMVVLGRIEEPITPLSYSRCQGAPQVWHPRKRGLRKIQVRLELPFTPSPC